MNVAEKIYKQMVLKGLNQKALARLSGVSDSEVSRILRAKSSPSLEYAARLARTLGVSLDYLADDSLEADPLAAAVEGDSIDRELAEASEMLGSRRARRILETAIDLGYEVAIRRLLGVEARPLIELGEGAMSTPERLTSTGVVHPGRVSSAS